MRTLTVLLILFTLSIVAVSQEALELTYPGHRIQVVGGLKGTRDADLTPFIAGSLDKLPKKQEKSRFGLLFRESGAKRSPAMVLEVSDVATGKVVREIGIEEWFGMGPLTWQRVPERTALTPDKIVSVFRPGATGVVVTRTIEKVADPAYPAGAMITMTIQVETPVASKLRARIKAKAEGTVIYEGADLTVVSATDSVALHPALVMSWGRGATINAGAAEKGRLQEVTITGGEVAVPANASTTILTVKVSSTTVPVADRVPLQAKELANYMRGQAARPQLVLMQGASSVRAFPGDTVTYSLNYYNIGTAPAGDVQISNPISSGTRYLEGSATGDDSEINLERGPAQPPAQGSVVKLTWKFNGAIAPGEGRSASFKVIVR